MLKPLKQLPQEFKAFKDSQIQSWLAVKREMIKAGSSFCVLKVAANIHPASLGCLTNFFSWDCDLNINKHKAANAARIIFAHCILWLEKYNSSLNYVEVFRTKVFIGKEFKQ